MVDPKFKRAFAKAQGFYFTPMYETDFVQGQHYAYAGIGAVVCKGVEEINVQGIGAIKTFVFEEMNMRMPKTLRVPEAKAEAAKIRKLADPETLDAALRAIESADGTFVPIVLSTSEANRSYPKMLESNDLNVLAELIRTTLGCDNSDSLYKGRPPKRMEHGDRAIFMVAGEYALVKGISFEDARKLFTEKSGKFRSIAPKSAETVPAVDQVSPNLP